MKEKSFYYMIRIGNPMSGLQKQIIDINHKVDQLHNVVERLSQQISILAGDEEHNLILEDETIEIEVLEPMITSDSIHDVSCPSVLSHKDILLEESHQYKAHNSYYADMAASPDLQIRRLTAQLTAAYNRIAILEEQLLARRIGSQV
jgi:hypothetical protein